MPVLLARGPPGYTLGVMRIKQPVLSTLLALLPFVLHGCSKTDTPGPTDPVYELAGGCFAVVLEDGRYLRGADDGYTFAAGSSARAAAFRLQPSDLGHYLLYDQDRHYVTAADASDETWTLRRTHRKSDIRIPYHHRYSDAEWALERPSGKTAPYLLRHLNSSLYLGAEGLVSAEEAPPLRLVARADCSVYPELALNASGTVRSEPWPDGDVYGFADAHSHLFTNLGFGGGGVFHGAPFHRLGVEHALGDCDEEHGTYGMRDIVGFFYGGDRELDPLKLPRILVEGSVGAFNHATDGYPTFSSWPNSRKIPTHQTQYYRWLERSYMAGLRLIFQHATGNSALCELMVGLGSQEAPYGCNDMVSVDLQIDAAHAMERYIDALSGGPGLGWFRIVKTPEEARRQINQGKLAVVLGIEISNVFDCFLTPPPGMPACTLEHVKDQVKRYYEKGVRVVFPVHKFDNGFSAGDGMRGALEIGNVINSGHYSSFTLDCPGIRTSFDRGGVTMGGLNKPRGEFFSRAPVNISQLSEDPVFTMLPILPDLAGGSLEGDYCQTFGLTDLGRALFDELMAYGMVIDVAHLPQWSVVEALEILDRNKYPAISTHGSKFDGMIYRHGGSGDTNLGRCGDPAQPGRMAEGFLAMAAEIKAANGNPAQPLAFDFNGFAGGPGPRFGPEGCSTPQVNPITYPFKSYDGGVTFEQPTLGERVVDFNEEGMVHIGLLPEYVEDVRRDGTTDADLEPLFRSAEALIRVWEAAEAAAK